jgi:hypothetical protein
MIKFIIAQSASKTVTALEAHPDFLPKEELGQKFPTVVVVTFSNGDRALVSTKMEKGCFTADADGNLLPAFISAQDTIMPGFRETNIEGTPWILAGTERSNGIKLP